MSFPVVACQTCNVNDPVGGDLHIKTMLPEEPVEPGVPWWADRQPGVLAFSAGLHLPLRGPALRSGEVLHLIPEEKTSFETVAMALYANGFKMQAKGQQAITVAWSSFALVQACRLHSVEADLQMPWLRLFKVSVFAHGSTHYFATRGDDADLERAGWVADIARAIRVLTLSLYPPFRLRAEPLEGRESTETRLLAGYLLSSTEDAVSLLYCELHCHFDSAAAFVAYEDERCEESVLRLSIDVHTCVSERVGVDCSCFSVDGHLFSTRTCQEKMLWLRAVSNVKVKLRHQASNPTPEDLVHYRLAVRESARGIRQKFGSMTQKALLPERPPKPKPVAPATTAAAANAAKPANLVVAPHAATLSTSGMGPRPNRPDSFLLAEPGDDDDSAVAAQWASPRPLEPDGFLEKVMPPEGSEVPEFDEEPPSPGESLVPEFDQPAEAPELKQSAEAQPAA